MKTSLTLALLAAAALLRRPIAAQQAQPFVRDSKIAIDADYTAKIKEYTTEPFFNSPLTDYLPASKTVPTPKAVLGDIAGAPGKLPYAEEVYDYMRRLEKASPRVKVYSIGKTEKGRDKMVDVYKWHLAHPGQNWPGLVYWGKYVAHDNNRDAMGATLKLTQNVLNTWQEWHPQVLHDLHESVPYLYDNTVGDGPYSAWIDPILADEWQMIGWNNVSEMTKFGMPGVFTHGNFDTWSPGYLMFIAALHNGISRLYETFGNGGADTVARELRPDEYARTWYKQNPPLPKTTWSQRNNNNYEQTGLLTSLHYFATNKQLFLRNFYTKSKRSILKAKTEGPAAYVFPADDPRPGAQADLLRVLQKQGVEISRATASFTVTVPGKKAPPRPSPMETNGGASPASA